MGRRRLWITVYDVEICEEEFAQHFRGIPLNLFSGGAAQRAEDGAQRYPEPLVWDKGYIWRLVYAGA